jgi:cytosine/adenosine deaminase-related metal-dependent hydrolase
MLLGRMRGGPESTGARDVLEVATRGGAACLGRDDGELGQLAVGSAGDLVCWPLEGIAFAGAITDPIEAWLRCGPVSARHTVVAGRAVVEDGMLVATGVEDVLARHTRAAEAMQRPPA